MTTVKHILVAILAYLLGSSVILSSVHAKDLASSSSDMVKLTSASKIHLEDISAKAIGELHNHVDKTSLKAFAKTVSDHNATVSNREIRAENDEQQQSFATFMIRVMFAMRIMYATTLRA